MNILITRLTLVFALFSTQTAYGELYRWVDDNGKVHYSDRPQSDQSGAIKTLPSSGRQNDQATLQQQQRFLDAYHDRRADEQRRQANEQQQQQQRQQEITAQCSEYKHYLKYGGGVYRIDLNGDRVFLKESEIAEYRAQKQAEYERHCQ